MQVMSTEGEDNGEWIIVDCGAAVAHIMQPAIRDYYHLEEIWGGKSVKMKLGDAKVSLPKASEAPTPAPKTSPKNAAAKAPAKKAPAKKVVARKAVAKKAPARRATAKKPLRPH
jgi:ribosome-associated protein